MEYLNDVPSGGHVCVCGCTAFVTFFSFSLGYPTGWAESISGNGVGMYVCMCVITSKMIIISAHRLHDPYKHTYSESL